MFEIIFTALLAIFIFWVFLSYNRIHEKFSRSVNMTLFSIDNPEDFIDHAGLLEIFRHLHREKWNRFLFGDPYIALEKVVSPVRGRGALRALAASNGVRPSGVRYYIAVPKNCEKILSGRPGLSKINDPFIPRNKFYSAAYFGRLPKKINFDNPKLNEDEGAVLQVLVRHLHWIKERAVFESNLEILVWADSKKRAGKILGLRSNKTAVFDFFHRIFENRKRVRISFKELKEVFLN